MHQIGIGVLGPVFRTYEPSEDRLVAVKAFHLDITPEQANTLVAALTRLVEADLVHPGIVAPIDVALEDGVPYMAQEYVAAESLDVAMRHYAPAPIETAMPFIRQIADAIDAAHERGVKHGALHLRDIFVTPDDVRVTGFGVVTALEELRLAGPIRRPYTAPEIISGRGWGNEADLFSLAAVAYELLTGRRAAGTGEQVTERLNAVDGVVDCEALQEVFATALSDNADERYSTGARFVSALESAIGRQGSGAAVIDGSGAGATSTESTDLLAGLALRRDAFDVSDDDVLPSRADLADRRGTAASPPADSSPLDAFEEDVDEPTDTVGHEDDESEPDAGVEPEAVAASPFDDAPADEDLADDAPVDQEQAEDAGRLALADEGPPAEDRSDHSQGSDAGDAAEPLELESLHFDSSAGELGGEDAEAESRPSALVGQAGGGDAVDDADDGDDADDDDDFLTSADDAGAEPAIADDADEDDPDDPVRPADVAFELTGRDERFGVDEPEATDEADDPETDFAPEPGFEDEVPVVAGWSQDTADTDTDYTDREYRYEADDSGMRTPDFPSGGYAADDGVPPLDTPERPSWVSRGAVPLVGIALATAALAYLVGVGLGSDPSPTDQVLGGQEATESASGGFSEEPIELTEPVGERSAGQTSAIPPPPPSPAPAASPPASSPPSATASPEPVREATEATVPDPPRPSPVEAAPVVGSGRLLVRTDPPGATVAVDGVSQGETPLSLADIAFGDHEVTIALPGFAPVSRAVTLGPTETIARVGVTLTPGTGSPSASPASSVGTEVGPLVVESRPSGADVSVNGESVGTTPLRLEVPFGRHVVRIENEGYVVWSTTVAVTDAEGARVGGSLERAR